MEFNKPIADMLPGMDVEGFYILRAAALKTTNNGKPFLSGTICDRTGSVEIKIWDYSGPIGARQDGLHRLDRRGIALAIELREPGRARLSEIRRHAVSPVVLR